MPELAGNGSTRSTRPKVVFLTQWSEREPVARPTEANDSPRGARLYVAIDPLPGRSMLDGNIVRGGRTEQSTHDAPTLIPGPSNECAETGVQLPAIIGDRIKRTIDVVISLSGLLITSPVLAAIAVLVRFRLGSPVLYRQVRAGRHGQEFVLLKFRTMHDAVGSDVDPETDEARLTTLGRRLRVWSLDELPSLLNILRGDMSLVGPRPLLPEYTTLYSPRHSRRLEVQPGLTGWAQIQGRNELDWSERFDLDVWYVEHRSLLLDLRILAVTVPAVLGGDGVSASGHATMPKFRGSD